jgi:hypothetical protein
MVGFKGLDMAMPCLEAVLSLLINPAGSVVSDLSELLSAGLTVLSGSVESTESILALLLSMILNIE